MTGLVFPVLCHLVSPPCKSHSF
uniref:Uncharacterized protein n=1 Tax=Rhizophora mucronata TaxID=61149 RepID=A0A2P2NB40_RHIMU